MKPFAITAATTDEHGRPVRRQRRFAAPTRGIRIAKEVDNFESRCDAALLALPPEAVLAEATAARLWNLPASSQSTRDPIVAVLPPGAWQPQREISHVFRRILKESEVTSMDGRRVTTAARTFADCARLWSFPDSLALGDAALARGLMTLSEVAETVTSMKRLRGLAAARHAARHLDARSGSPQESRVRAIIIAAGLPWPEPNMRITDLHGGFLAIGDLCYREWRIVIEYDGAHHRDPLQQAKDATRRTRLREAGWYVVEITGADLRWPSRVVEKVSVALRIQGAL